LLVGLLGGALAAVAKAVQSRVGTAPESAPAPPASWTPLPNAEPVVVPPKATSPTVRATAPVADLQESPITPPSGTPAVQTAPAVTPAAPAPAKKAATSKKPAPAKRAEAPPAPWVEPVDDEAPSSHPIKAKLSSGIYHSPGGLNYERTKPDRCYRDAAAAEADGLRPAKR
jgi:hypothetical protein